MVCLLLVPSCSPTGNKPDSSPRVPRMTFLLSKQDNSAPPRSPKHEAKDESSPPKSPWGINIMKKAKKASPKAFGVRLEDCQPATNNKVWLLCSQGAECVSNAHVSVFTCVCVFVCVVHSPDCGDLLWVGGGHGSGVYRDLQSARKQCRSVQSAGAAQQRRRHQHCWGGELFTHT